MRLPGSSMASRVLLFSTYSSSASPSLPRKLLRRLPPGTFKANLRLLRLPPLTRSTWARTPAKPVTREIFNSWQKTPHWKTTLNIKGGPSKARL